MHVCPTGTCAWVPNGSPDSCASNHLYSVKEGDTLAKVAAYNCGATLKALLSSNTHVNDADKICPGDVICCPSGECSV